MIDPFVFGPIKTRTLLMALIPPPALKVMCSSFGKRADQAKILNQSHTRKLEKRTTSTHRKDKRKKIIH